MTNDENIVRYTPEELRDLIRNGQDRTDWEKVDSMTDEKLEELIANDPEEQANLPDWTKIPSGPLEPKEQITLRIDADVLRFFREQGRGYQTRMNVVLRAYMEALQKADSG